MKHVRPFSLNSSKVSPELGQRVVDTDDPDKALYLPEEYDIMPTGRCMFRCAGCWGASHSSPEPSYSAEHWTAVANFAERQNRHYRTLNHGSRELSVCISGGEPLLYWDIVKLAGSLPLAGVRTTLSTTGNGPEGVFEEVITSGIHELGIPIDASSGEINALWRQGKISDGGLQNAIRAIRLSQEIAPGVLTTIRTLLHDGNVGYVAQIPDLLEKNGIDTSKIIWKGYLFNAFTGPRIGQDGVPTRHDTDGLKGSVDSIYEARDRFLDVAIKASTHTHPRLIIGPDGACAFEPIRSIEDASNAKDVYVGNIFSEPAKVVHRLNGEFQQFLAHCNNAAGMDRLIQMLDTPFADLDASDLRLLTDQIMGVEMPAYLEL